ncbi:MAG: glycosyltransferase family 2 protein [Lachnospiraceae bacterium]|nr:glycosyltransferase family 2 protein [Lachnospiraceae bacterium]
MSKISVLIVTYNYGRFLAECIDSVMAQDCGEELEILVVDDGSTDDTPKVVANFPQVNYIRQEHRGVSAARNTALKRATGDYLAFLDADDYWKPEKLRLQMAYLKEHPECKIVFTAYENFLESSVSAQEEWVKRCCQFAEHDIACLPTALFHRSILNQCGLFSEDLERGEDSEWTYQIWLQKIPRAYMEEKLYLRRLHGKNLTGSGAKQCKEQRKQFQKDIVHKSIRAVRRNNMEKNGISVLIPAWNAQKFIVECIESVKKQKFTELPVEIIVVDDGSEDDTAELAKQAGAVVCKAEHRGAAASRNTAITMAQYSWLFFLDADDRLTEGAFEALYAPIQKDGSLSAVFSYARDFYDLPGRSTNAGEEGKVRTYSGCLPGCSLIRKEVFRKVGPFDLQLKTGETVAWQLKFRNTGLPSCRIEYVTLERRIHENNTGRRMRGQEQMDYARILREHLRQKKKGE